MGDEDDGLVQLLLKPQQLVLKLGTGDGVQGAEGLVHEDDLRVHGKGTCHADALLLAAGQLGGVAVQVLVRVHAHQVHQLQRPRPGAFRVGFGQAGDDLDVLPDGHVGEQAGLLDDVAHAAPELEDVLVPDVLAADVDLTGGGLDEAVDHL